MNQKNTGKRNVTKYINIRKQNNKKKTKEITKSSQQCYTHTAVRT